MLKHRYSGVSSAISQDGLTDALTTVHQNLRGAAT